jgi:hypothetical protein
MRSPLSVCNALVSLIAYASLGCLSAPAPGSEPLELLVLDARGRSVDPDALPRRIQLGLSVQLDPQGPGPLLFEGPADAALLRDLERLPLNAADMRRALPLELEATGAALRITPQRTLARGARYTFALPRSALPAAVRGSLERAFVRELGTADDPSAGAAVSGAFPADGSAGVPTRLRSALLWLDGQAGGFADGVWLQDAAGSAVPAEIDSQPCDALESGAITCIRLRPLAPLAPHSTYSLRTGRGLRDAQGVPVEAFSAQFSTAEDDAAPVLGWRTSGCALDETGTPVGCAAAGERAIELRLQPDGPALIVAQLGSQRQARVAGGAAVSVHFRDLEPNRAYALAVSASDSIGRTQLQHLEVATAPPLATLAISEVRANPLGSEPAQEFVELWNFGERALQLQGIRLSESPEDPGIRIEAALDLPPSGRALLVSDSFDPDDALDIPPAPGAPLLRIGSALTRSGLSNAGEPLFLRDAQGHRLSAAPALAAPAGSCIARIGADPRSGDAASFAVDPDSGCTPGR